MLKDELSSSEFNSMKTNKLTVINQERRSLNYLSVYAGRNIKGRRKI